MVRGDEVDQGHVFSYVSAEKRVPADHPLRKVRKLVDTALEKLSKDFDRLQYFYGGLWGCRWTIRSGCPPPSLTSAEHFSVDGTLLEAWASQKSFKPKDGSGGSGGSGDGV